MALTRAGQVPAVPAVPAVPDLGEFHQVLHRLAEQLGVDMLLGASRHVIPQRQMFHGDFTMGFHHGIPIWDFFAHDLLMLNGIYLAQMLIFSWGYQEKHGIFMECNLVVPQFFNTHWDLMRFYGDLMGLTRISVCFRIYIYIYI